MTPEELEQIRRVQQLLSEAKQILNAMDPKPDHSAPGKTRPYELFRDLECDVNDCVNMTNEILLPQN